MAFKIPSYESIRDGLLRDIRARQPEADIASDSDHYVRAASFAAAVEGLYHHQSWLYRQIFVDTADEEALLRAAAERGILRKGASFASGDVPLTGAVGITLRAGATLKHLASGELFTAVSDAAIDTTGTANAQVRASTPGAALNGLTGPLTLTSPPLGMDASTQFIEPTRGGEDQESLESVRQRLLEDIQFEPAGGTRNDYARWAKEVPGVADAYVLPKRRGVGTVDVVIVGSEGIPSAEVIAACQAHIEERCSVIADVWVFAPVPRVVDCVARVELDGSLKLEAIQVVADAAWRNLVSELAPGETLRLSRIEAMISNLAGVTDRIVTVPTGNVPATVDGEPWQVGWVRPGAIRIEPIA